MVERFIAPVLKTGDPSRGPGVRIPLPLQNKNDPGKSRGFLLLIKVRIFVFRFEGGFTGSLA